MLESTSTTVVDVSEEPPVCHWFVWCQSLVSVLSATSGIRTYRISHQILTLYKIHLRCFSGKLQMNSKYNKVLKTVAETLERGKYMTSVQNQDRGILRICEF